MIDISTETLLFYLSVIAVAMIDISREQVIPLNDLSKLLPDRPSKATIWRWRNRGARGRKLESFALGGKVYTSIEALQRFAEQQGGSDTPTIRTPRQREREIAKAERELAREGV